MARGQAKLSGPHPEEIKARVRMTGVSLEQASLAHGYGKGFLSAALKRPLFAAEQIIAKLVSERPHRLWPDRYDTDDNPLYQVQPWNRRKRHHRHLRLVKG
jgi:lambda repressor-like predicted transcriptional regulator